PGAPSQISTFRSRGTHAAPLPVQTGDELGYFAFRGYNGSLYAYSSYLQAKATENHDTLNRGARLEIFTTPNGTITPIQHLTINHNGFIGIGATNPSAKLEVAGDILVGGSTA